MATTHERVNAQGYGTLTRDELRAELEHRTRSEFGLPLADFLARLRAGELDQDALAVTDLAFLARMLERAEHKAPRDNGRQRGFFAAFLERFAS